MSEEGIRAGSVDNAEHLIAIYSQVACMRRQIEELKAQVALFKNKYDQDTDATNQNVRQIELQPVQ